MNSRNFILIFLVALMLMSHSEQHDYYVSVTEIGYSEKDKSIQIISQIFIDDFETLLRKRYDETITLAEADEPEIVETYMERYLSDKLRLKVNGDPVEFSFIGKEYKDDITYCYLEIEDISNIKSVEVTNRSLFDVLSEQQNIVRLKLLGKNKSYLLVPDNDTCVLNFN